ncbi:MAG: class I SAM-dependent methyltransferase [Vicinamibacterales bacterium]
MLFKFRRTRSMDPLQVAMTGVRMGERFLQIGVDDRTLLAGLAAKVGLSGAAALAAPDDAQASRGQKAAARAGVLLDLKVGPLDTLDFPDAAFDMVVVDDTAGGFAARPDTTRGACLREALRVLRPGGRIELVEGVGGGFLRTAPTRPDGYHAEQSLAAAGFRPVRALAEKDGFRFIEGLKGASLSNQESRIKNQEGD